MEFFYRSLICFSYFDYGDYQGEGHVNYDRVTNLVSNGKLIVSFNKSTWSYYKYCNRYLNYFQLFLLIIELKRFSGHPLANDIDRQLFGIPLPVLFALAVSVVAFGGVAGQAGIFDAISDILGK